MPIRGLVLLTVVLATLSATMCRPAGAINININFVPGYFGSNSTAQATVLQAAADVSAAITSSLTVVNQDNWQAPVGNSTVTFDWAYQYRHPTSGSQVTINPGHAAANTVTVWVGDSNILQANTLGTGSPATLALQYGASWSGNSILSDFGPAVAQLNALSEAEYRRGAGAYTRRRANIGLDINDDSVNDVTALLDVDYGVAYGSVQLDVDTNNNGVTDDTGMLSNFWHLDHQTPVPAGKNDLYSIMIHELLHVLGVGSSDSWSNQVNNTEWYGAEALDEYGTSSGLIHPDGDHVAQSLMSRSIVNGAMQEVAMDPNITTGTRKYLTTLDLAFLRDIGYSTVEPEFGPTGDYNGDGIVDAADYLVWRNSLGSTTNLAADGNGSGAIDKGDYTVWKSHFGQAGAAASSLGIAAVPEPATLFGVLLAGSLLLGWRRFAR